MITTDVSELIQAHTATPAGMTFYATLEAAQSDQSLLGYASVIKRAWREIKLDGVLCLDGRPVLYLKLYGRPFSTFERIHLQKLFWNQGVANILVLADPVSVFIYSGLARPCKDDMDHAAAENALVRSLKLTDYVQRIRSLYHDLASGHYYEENQKYFEPSQAVDAWLLDNLRALRDTLTQGKEKLDTKTAHAFIGRILFLCYLLDREIITVSEQNGSRTGTLQFAEIIEKLAEKDRIDYLYEIFADLKERFNGNMFDQDLNAERQLIRPSHLNKLILFLGGHDVKSGQRTLGFWPYNFKMIPVETISAIYQDFLATEDREKQRKRGAFYTPRFLAEMVVDLAVRDDPHALDGTFLDPACGSGIFLVILFNRLANRWIHLQGVRAHYTTKAKALREILERQIRGVDLEETACRVTCFSLYLAYLDFFDPPDIREHIERTGRPLPKLLDYGDEPHRPAADIAVISKADFLADNTLAGKAFHCIIGNPPWEGRGSKQLAQKFVQKAPQMLQKGGTGCLLLPTKILQNQTDSFQAQWLGLVTLEKVLQLADYSFLLFQEALCPAIITRFKKSPPEGDHLMEFAAPKFNRAGLRKGVVIIDPSARTWIPLADLLAATRSDTAPIVWKRRLWGTSRDQKLLDLFQSLPPLRDQVDVLSESRRQGTKKSKRWVAGVGIKPWPEDKQTLDRAPKELRWAHETPFIETTPWISDLILFPSETIPLEERLKKKRYRTDVLYSQPPSDLFSGPMVLFSNGFGKVSFCDFDVIFQDSLRSIKGPREDADLLMFLAAYLRSSLARYFLFHTAASWGAERDKVHFGEVLRAPFPLPETGFTSTDAKQIIKHVAQRLDKLSKDLQATLNQIKTRAKRYSLLKEDNVDIRKQWLQERKKIVDIAQNEINPLIYQYFGLTAQEITLVEDTMSVFEPSSTPTTWRSKKLVTLDPLEKANVAPYSEQGLGAYADALVTTLNTWAKSEDSLHRVYAEGGTDVATGLAMITIHLSRTERPFRRKSLSRELAKVLKTFNDSISKSQGALYYQRDILLFQDGRIHIVRPNILLNWTRTAALNDAAKIYGEIALAKEES